MAVLKRSETFIWCHRYGFSWGQYSFLLFVPRPYQIVCLIRSHEKIFRHRNSANESDSSDTEITSLVFILLVIFLPIQQFHLIHRPLHLHQWWPVHRFDWVSNTLTTPILNWKRHGSTLPAAVPNQGHPPNKQQVRLRDSFKIRKNWVRVLQRICLSTIRNTAAYGM